MRLTFGNPTAWTNSLSDYYITKHGTTMEFHTDAIMNEMNKLVIFDTAKDYNKVTVVSSSAILLYTCLDDWTHKSTVNNKMKSASAKFGSRYYMFNITKEIKYNGWYAYSVDSFEVKKI